MPWTDPITYVANERLTGAQMNEALRDNMLALKYPPTASYIAKGRTADYSTTSTSFTAVDSTNMALSITTTGNGSGGNADVMIGLCGTVYSAGSIRIYFQILEDGVALNADDGLLVSEGSGVRPVGFMFLRANATPATHVYTLNWKVGSGTGFLLAGAGTSTRNCVSQFWVREVS
jgi:hypothetical protein